MFDSDKRVLVRHYLDQGVAKAEIARRLNIGRRTVYNWSAGGKPGHEGCEGKYGPRPSQPSKLDCFKEIIAVRLAVYPQLSAVRLFDEVKAAGYTGGYDQVKRHVREVRPRAVEEPLVRFETAPAQQAQVDFAEFQLPWGKRHALLVVLGYSRRMWLRFYRRQTLLVVVRGLEESFSYLGGVPAELLFDQMKAVVLADRRGVDGGLIENPEFRAFSDHWGFKIRACRPYRARTKGKVERPVRYLRGNFFYGREFVSDDDLNAQARQWLDEVANVRVHGTLQERVSERFARERPLLGPLAPRPYTPVVPREEPREEPQQDPDRVPATLAGVEVERRPLSAYALGGEVSS